MRDDGLAETEGEGYFASVSDLMVGVLFVFLLMLTILALNFRDDSAQLDKLKAELAAAEAKAAAAESAANTLKTKLTEVANEVQKEMSDREAARNILLGRLESQLLDSGIKVAVDRQSGVLRLSDSVPFATGSNALTDETRHTLLALSAVFARVLPCFASNGDRLGCQSSDQPILETVLIEGHTDSQTYAQLSSLQSEQENDRLSAARALSVFTEIRQRQPSLDALRNPANQPLLGISGYGQRRPLDNGAGQDERNRRIDVRFVLSSRNSDKIKQLLDSIRPLLVKSAPRAEP